MKRVFCVLICLLISVILVTCGPSQTGRDAQATRIAADLSATHMVDGFDMLSGPLECSPFHREHAVRSYVYCIYFNAAQVELSPVPLEDQNRGLRIKYALPPIYAWGNWLSIRRETGIPIDLSTYSGLELRVRVEEPSDAILRIALADVAYEWDVGVKGHDELWWCDHRGILSGPAGEWQTVSCPFTNFDRSSGEGTRVNDKRLNLVRIVAYELSIVSMAETNPEGSIVVDSLMVLK